MVNARALGPALNDEWRQYLALPPELSTPGRVPDLAALQGVVKKFDTVAGNPQYKVLNQRPEFAAMRDALGSYYEALLAQQRQPLNLPPPPQ
jgi:hypothetical protein